LHQQILPEITGALQSSHARQRLSSLLDDRQFESFVLASQIWSPSAWKAWEQAFDGIRKEAEATLPGRNIEAIIRNAILETISRQPDAPLADQTLAISIIKGLQSEGLYRKAEEWRQLFPTSISERLSHIINEIIPDSKKIPIVTGTEPDKVLPPTTEPLKQQSESIKQPEPEEGIFIQNAGLVILALYLPTFFTNLSLLDEKSKITDIPRAIALLRYLVYEVDDFEEIDIVLEKLLCGIPLAESIASRYTIQEEEKRQADELLQAVIDHWTVLKNTTPAGLRHSFLQREGKLSFHNNQWELTVHRQAHDILLDYLPWSISMIKLQWMPHLLVVKWIK
jgi:hypothetical protein